MSVVLDSFRQAGLHHCGNATVASAGIGGNAAGDAIGVTNSSGPKSVLSVSSIVIRMLGKIKKLRILVLARRQLKTGDNSPAQKVNTLPESV